MAIIFQYGSNLNSERLNSQQRLRGEARYLGLACTTEPHELGFTVWSEGNDCAAADLIPGGSQPAWGALYEIPDALVRRESASGRPSMASIENEGVEYHCCRINVCRPDGRPLAEGALTWLAAARRYDLKTEFHYVRHILTGLLDKGVPDDYLRRVRHSILQNNARLQSSVDHFIASRDSLREQSVKTDGVVWT